MNKSKVVAVIKNDVERSVKNKWFLILNIILLITIVVGLNFSSVKALFTKSSDTNLESERDAQADTTIHIYVEDEESIAYKTLQDILKDNADLNIEKVESIDEYSSNLTENIMLLKIIADDEEYIKAQITTMIQNDYVDLIIEALNTVKNTLYASDKDLTISDIESIKSDIAVEVNVTETETSDSLYLVQIVTTYIIFFVLLLCLNKVANTISQEKLSNSIEYVLTSITTKEYIIAKVTSVCIICILQFIFVLCYLLIGIMLNTILNLNSLSEIVIDSTTTVSLYDVISGKLLVYLLIVFVFMCFTIFLQGIIQSMFSAKASNIQESGNATLTLVVLNLALYSIVTLYISQLSSVNIITYVVSVLPIVSMYFIPTMFILGQANVFQIIVALVVLIASIPLFMIAIQKPFKNAILDYMPKKNKGNDSLEKIKSIREYQERITQRKETSKQGFIIGISIILFILIQIIGGAGISVIAEVISRRVTVISSSNIYLILMCILFVLSIYLPYLLLKLYISHEPKVEISKEERKKSIIQCIKYIVLAIPIISIIQRMCSFAIEYTGITSDATNILGLFNYSGKLSTVLVFILIAVLPAIFEELLIRKGIMEILKDRGGIFTVIVSALIFAIIHMNLSQFMFAFMIGILFGIIRLKTKRMYPTMILHFLNNALALVEILFYNHTTFITIYTYIIIAVNAVGFCILIYMLYLKVMELKDKENLERLKEKFDYRKIKVNLMENIYIFKDFTFFTMFILAISIFVVIERVLAIV